MAAVGHTPIAEIQFADYVFPAFDQVFFLKSTNFVKCPSNFVRLLTRRQNIDIVQGINLTVVV
jgi:pyruvate/2-oxoglutarate/acetoin dehydrogenase E1 component